MSVVLVHGIWNRQQGMTAQEAAAGLARQARPQLERGLAAAGLGHLAVPEVVMAYYAHLLTDGPQERQDGEEDGLDRLSERELAEVWEWLTLAGVPGPEEAQAVLLAPVRQALGWLVRARAGGGAASRARQELMARLSRLVVATVRETAAYTSLPERRRAVRELLADTIRTHRPRVVVAHSLGSVVAYETLHAFPELEVELLVTLGSPLGLPALFRQLEPGPLDGRGARPAGVGRWVNIADAGDLVALPPELGGLFPVDSHGRTDIGFWDPHTLGGYLANGLTGAAIAPYVTS
ncbi:hypothetical protein ABT095_07175 [Kitasatospora sp. NPDC002227]|uniref:hypothetical protein n=1 Tax=Kitasatospora sp. NPDC002227 TaxID=3154773 RepID=UPI00331D6902